MIKLSSFPHEYILNSTAEIPSSWFITYQKRIQWGTIKFIQIAIHMAVRLSWMFLCLLLRPFEIVTNRRQYTKITHCMAPLLLMYSCMYVQHSGIVAHWLCETSFSFICWLVRLDVHASMKSMCIIHTRAVTIYG